MFSKILHANDGSEHAFHALNFAIGLARQNSSELHMICVEEVDYMPEFIEEVREETGSAARRYHTVIQRARATADDSQVKLRVHVVAGHPVRDIADLAVKINANLLVIGAILMRFGPSEVDPLLGPRVATHPRSNPGLSRILELSDVGPWEVDRGPGSPYSLLTPEVRSGPPTGPRWSIE